MIFEYSKAGFKKDDPSYPGSPLQLEIWNVGPLDVKLEEGMPICQLIFEEVQGNNTQESRVRGWEKTQSVRAAKYTVWDHSFELPNQDIDATATFDDSATVGTVSHTLKNSANSNLEIYDYPGGVANHFDGVSHSGGDQPAEIGKISDANTAISKLRNQEQAAQVFSLRGTCDYPQLIAGRKFTLDRHFEDNGTYALTAVHTSFDQSSFYRSKGTDSKYSYGNQFTCIPITVPFRPQRLTPKPIIHGTQTAVVVGPSGEEIWVDKYSRVMVEFYWQRGAAFDGAASCWVRVASAWAGKSWGTIAIPRVGMEVVVAFEEGNPDCPIVTGCVYNADNMPPYVLPDNKTRSTWKSFADGGFNEIRFEDKSDAQQIFIHAEKDLDLMVKADRREHIEKDRHLTVKGQRLESVAGDVHVNHKAAHKEKIGGRRDLNITGVDAVSVGGNQSLKVSGNIGIETSGGYSVKFGSNLSLKGSAVVIETTTGLTLKCGGNFITMDSSGIYIQGTMVYLNTGGAPQPAMMNTLDAPADPTDPTDAGDDSPGFKTAARSGSRPPEPA